MYGFGSGIPDPFVLNDGTFTDLTATGSFTSPGIDDNATSTQVTVTDTGTEFADDLRVEGTDAIVAIQVKKTGQATAQLRSQTGVAYSGTSDNFPYGFLTNGSERARFDTSGNLLVGVTSGAKKLVVNGDSSMDSVTAGSYTVATLPSASGLGAGTRIHVTDETGGATDASSDGTNWRRYADRAIVS